MVPRSWGHWGVAVQDKAIVLIRLHYHETLLMGFLPVPKWNGDYGGPAAGRRGPRFRKRPSGGA